MIKRPLNAQFDEKVLLGIKTTTIRDKAWPVGIPIMLYNWSGAAYRSPQVDVAAVVVEETQQITISRKPEGMRYSVSFADGKILWKSEGFESGEEMDAWFSAKMRPDEVVLKHLMIFKLVEKGVNA